MFPSLTLERIESFAAGYRDSEEEKGHILEAYKEHAGDYDMVLDSVMCAREEDLSRFQAVVAAAIAAGDTKAMGDDDDEMSVAIDSNAAASALPTPPPCKGKKGPSDKLAAAKAAKAKKRADKAAKEAVEAEELLREIQQKQQKRLGGSGGGGTDLASMIQQRNAERSGGFDNWAAGLEARYSKGKKKGKK
mmetsp:Transcript_16339/g.33420  ORF Transcript_16339/g.33420 Transcript_16339/m.33420 type:complete len:191 (+) Transcript_16339:395-967(+)